MWLHKKTLFAKQHEWQSKVIHNFYQRRIPFILASAIS